MNHNLTTELEKHLIFSVEKPAMALTHLNKLGRDAVLFIVDTNQKLLGSLTDGDIRRGLIQGLTLDSDLLSFTQQNPIYLEIDNIDLKQLSKWRKANFKIFPIVDKDLRIVQILNVRLTKSLLPVTALIMAGGIGSRLKPLTDNTPKPMLPVGGKPIVEQNIDRLKYFGINSFYLSIKYLGDTIKDYFKDGSSKNINITYLTEDKPLGTIGAASQIVESSNEYLLVMNSDILTNIDFENMFLKMKESDADIIVATTQYEVKIPYGIVETKNNTITGLKEKPSYIYYSNAGIYMMKYDCIEYIPKDARYDATELIGELIRLGKKVINYPILGYWLDIGKHQDYVKANNDFESITFL